MTTDATELARNAQQQIMDSVEALQTTVLQSARALGDIVDKLVPSNLRGVTVPGADSLPSAEDTISLGFDFAERVLASQRKFVEELTAIQGSGATATARTSKAKAAAK
jgi:hypothetical protein